MWIPVSSLTTGTGLSRWEKYYFGKFLMMLQFIFISLSLVCIKETATCALWMSVNDLDRLIYGIVENQRRLLGQNSPVSAALT